MSAGAGGIVLLLEGADIMDERAKQFRGLPGRSNSDPAHPRRHEREKVQPHQSREGGVVLKDSARACECIIVHKVPVRVHWGAGDDRCASLASYQI